MPLLHRKERSQRALSSYTIEDLWSELQRVRKALEVSERKADKLEQRVNELEEENRRIRTVRQKTEEFLQATIRKLEKDVNFRDKKIEKLNKRIAWFERQHFGRKTEKSRPEATEAQYVSQRSYLGKKIVTAAPPPKLNARTNIGNSLWVHLIVHKFLHGVPINRTLKELSLYGFSRAEGTIAGGFKIIDELLQPLQNEIVKHCRGADFRNADETTWHVFDAGTTKWWLWLIHSHDAVAYILDPSRSKKVPSDFFADSTGVLMTDCGSKTKLWAKPGNLHN